MRARSVDGCERMLTNENARYFCEIILNWSIYSEHPCAVLKPAPHSGPQRWCAAETRASGVVSCVWSVSVVIRRATVGNKCPGQMARTTSDETKSSQQQRVEYSKFTVDGTESSYPNGGRRCCGRFCFKGYFWAVVAALYFFVVFPACMLLVIVGHHKGVALTLCLGIFLLVAFTCLIPGAYIWIHRWKKRRRQMQLAARALHCATKEKTAFVNDAHDDAEFNATT